MLGAAKLFHVVIEDCFDMVIQQKRWMKWERKLCKEMEKKGSEQKGLKTFMCMWVWCVCGIECRPLWFEWGDDVREQRAYIETVCYSKKLGLWYNYV